MCKEHNQINKKKNNKKVAGDVSGHPVVRLHTPSAGGMGSVPDWDT